MTGGLRQRALLTPSGHAAIDQPRIARLHHVRPEPQALHHAGTKTLDQGVGIGQEVEHLRDRGFVFEVEFDDLFVRARPPISDSFWRRRGRA